MALENLNKLLVGQETAQNFFFDEWLTLYGGHGQRRSFSMSY